MLMLPLCHHEAILEQKTVHEMIDFANGRNFTHVIVLGEKHKVCNG